jgi:hypothetical protein
VISEGFDVSLRVRFPPLEGLLPSVRAFIDFLAAEYAQIKRLEQMAIESHERRIKRRGPRGFRS